MSDPITSDLGQHLSLCQEILALVERESLALRQGDEARRFEFYQSRKALLPRLDESLSRIKRQRLDWQRLPSAERARQPAVTGLLRQNQDLIMKILVLDRENEQQLLRRGLVPPKHLPPAERQRPHFVADLYRRQGGR
ncbi:MAG: hypothetical protein HZA92_07790 [Verrucomicrobia bacterium]|nr:hypothetical protein [Verrucomicrobiota bacterium]